jgi:hypothetical protein
VPEIASSRLGSSASCERDQDPELRALQERNMEDLKKLGADILAFPTDYPFYLSRKLDLDQAKQKWSDQPEAAFRRFRHNA